MNLQADRETDGCALTAVLIIGLLLTPFLIGLLILLIGLPMSFHTRITAYYIPVLASGYQPAAGAPLGIPAPLTRPLLPGRSPQAYAAYAPSAPAAASGGGWMRSWVHQVREFMATSSKWERIALATFGIAVFVVALVGMMFLVQIAGQ